MTLYHELSSIFIPNWDSTTPNYTKYRGFYRVDVSKLGTPHRATCFQYRLESKRPLIDYIQLPDHSLLIGYSRDFEDLKKAATELILEYLLKETKRHKDINRKVLSSLEYITHHAAPMVELTPEEFI